MIRTGLFLFAGLLLGLAIHLAVILILPAVAGNAITAEIAALAPPAKLTLIATPQAGGPNPMRLDPDLSYAVCRLDLGAGPGVVSGLLPQAFWSVAVFDSAGTVIYGTTNRDGIGQNLDLGIFNPAQTRLLAEQKIDIEQGLLIVEARTDEVFVVVRLAPPQPPMRARYEAQLGELACGNIRL
ncbi:MAG: DUF1254 domain-containing protein [Devosia sp.]